MREKLLLLRFTPRMTQGRSLAGVRYKRVLGCFLAGERASDQPRVNACAICCGMSPVPVGLFASCLYRSGQQILVTAAIHIDRCQRCLFPLDRYRFL